MVFTKYVYELKDYLFIFLQITQRGCWVVIVW